jgi:hypothetical protein
MELVDKKTGQPWGYITVHNQAVRLSDGKCFDLNSTNLIDPLTKKTVFHLEF